MRPGESNVGGTLLVQKCLFHRKINANIIVTLRRGLHSISGLASAAGRRAEFTSGRFFYVGGVRQKYCPAFPPNFPIPIMHYGFPSFHVLDYHYGIGGKCFLTSGTVKKIR